MDRDTEAKEKTRQFARGRKFWFIFPGWQFRIIDPKFQFTIYAYFLGLASITIGLVTYWTRANFVNFITSNDFIFMIISILVVFVIFAGILSHKIVGPLYNMKNHICRARTGNEGLPLKFRKDDFFQDLCDEYNQFLQSISDKR